MASRYTAQHQCTLQCEERSHAGQELLQNTEGRNHWTVLKDTVVLREQ